MKLTFMAESNVHSNVGLYTLCQTKMEPDKGFVIDYCLSSWKVLLFRFHVSLGGAQSAKLGLN